MPEDLSHTWKANKRRNRSGFLMLKGIIRNYLIQLLFNTKSVNMKQYVDETHLKSIVFGDFLTSYWSLISTDITSEFGRNDDVNRIGVRKKCVYVLRKIVLGVLGEDTRTSHRISRGHELFQYWNWNPEFSVRVWRTKY